MCGVLKSEMSLKKSPPKSCSDVQLVSSHVISEFHEYIQPRDSYYENDDNNSGTKQNEIETKNDKSQIVPSLASRFKMVTVDQGQLSTSQVINKACQPLAKEDIRKRQKCSAEKVRNQLVSDWMSSKPQPSQPIDSSEGIHWDQFCQKCRTLLASHIERNLLVPNDKSNYASVPDQIKRKLVIIKRGWTQFLSARYPIFKFIADHYSNCPDVVTVRLLLGLFGLLLILLKLLIFYIELGVAKLKNHT